VKLSKSATKKLEILCEVLGEHVFHFIFDVWQKQATCLHQFCVKLSKSATKTLAILCEVLGEHSLNQTECQLKMVNVQGHQTPAKRQCSEIVG
jgi:hypothetical protein